MSVSSDSTSAGIVPNLMAVVAVGDFDTELIEAKIKQHFAPPPEGEAMQERAAAVGSRY